MAAFEMWDFITSTGAADTTGALDVTPQRVLPEASVKHQIVHLADDDSEETISLSNKSIFYTTLQWGALTESDAGTIFNFWHSTGLGNGIVRSFRWPHPTDGHTYTVRFANAMTRVRRLGNIHSVASIRLKILGRAT